MQIYVQFRETKICRTPNRFSVQNDRVRDKTCSNRVGGQNCFLDVLIEVRKLYADSYKTLVGFL